MRGTRERLALSSRDLFPEIPPEAFPFPSTAEVEPADTVLCQERGMAALELGFTLDAPGYNIFLAGATGTGRSTAVRLLLSRLAPSLPTPPDRVLVKNFSDPDRPRLITLPPGQGPALARRMEGLVDAVRRRAPSILEDKAIEAAREELTRKVAERQRALLEQLERSLKEDGFALVQMEAGGMVRPEVLPVWEGRPVPLEELESLASRGLIPTSVVESLRTKHALYHEALNEVMRSVREAAREAESAFREVLRRTLATLVEPLLAEIREAFRVEELTRYLEELREDLVAGFEELASGGKEAFEERLKAYRVNVLVSREPGSGAPVVFENHPSYTNLFGTVERVGLPGPPPTHMNVKAGSVLAADGGFLVLSAIDLLLEPGSWEGLKRTLKSGLLEIQAPWSAFFPGPSFLKPEPIPVKVKVALVGTPFLYYLLLERDPDFSKIFKVKAEFDAVMETDSRALEYYARVVARIVRDEGLLHVTADGLSALVGFGTREAGRRGKISARFSEVADVLREASFIARREGKGTVGREEVERALEARRERHGLLEAKVKEAIQEDLILIETEGFRVGRINGLSVYDLGDSSFGKPTRITASASPGRAGIINVEREARLSGGIYDKGVLIIAGYLRRQYARERPLSITASLCFEQSYAGVEGDSASVAELLALLSEISGVPLDQGVAVTGSINQHGDVQPVGAVNEKIEGFFDLCAARGLTGSQGVIIPRKNVPDLALKAEVRKAVEEGRFHIWAVERVEEAIEIATGVPAGERGPDGEFPPGTFNRAVEDALARFSRALQEGPPDYPPAPGAPGVPWTGR